MFLKGVFPSHSQQEKEKLGVAWGAAGTETPVHVHCDDLYHTVYAITIDGATASP